MRLRRALLTLPVAAALAAAAAPPACAQTTPEDLRAFRAAVPIADRAPEVLEQRRIHPDLRATSFRRTGDEVEVLYTGGGLDVAAVLVDVRTRRILEAWTGWAATWHMARGKAGDYGRAWNSPWVWLPLGLLFLAPFVDPRRPLRLLHLDLLVLLGFGVSHAFFNRADIETSVPLAYPVLGYLLVRMLQEGRRPSCDAGPLVPLVPIRVLAGGALALLAARIALNVADSNVIDVGFASVIGADRVLGGESLYGPEFAEDPPHGDTYGPLTYLAYVPFVAIFGWSGEWDALPAAHAAAITFDGLTALAVLLLGRRLRPGAGGTALGVALAWAWLANPWTAFVLMTNSNDALVALLVSLALLAVGSAPARGVLVALGGAAKFAPLALAPLLAPRRGGRPLLLYGAALLATLAILTLPFVPDGGLSELYDRTIGFQAGRESPFSLWGLHPSLDGVHLIVQVAAVNLALLLLLAPARPTHVQVAALAAAVLIALQIAAVHWFYLYVAWFLPPLLVALFAGHGRVAGVGRTGRS